METKNYLEESPKKIPGKKFPDQKVSWKKVLGKWSRNLGNGLVYVGSWGEHWACLVCVESSGGINR